MLTILGGCTTLNPESDYGRAATLISEHTASNTAYTPTDEAYVSEWSSELLDGELSVEESVGIALLNNRKLQIRFADIGVARADLVQSQLLKNPSLSLGMMLPQGGGRSKLGFSFAQEIADLWQIPLRKRAGEQQIEIAIMDVVTLAVDVAAQTKSEYYSLVAIREQIAAIDASIADTTYTLARTRHHFDAGDVSLLDVNLARSTLIALQAKRIGFLRDQERAVATFVHVLGLSAPNDLPALSDSLPPTMIVLSSELNLIAWAGDHRIDVQRALATVEAANANLQLERRRAFPSLGLSLDVERSDARAPVSPRFNPLGTLIAPGATGADLARDYLVNRVDAKRDQRFQKEQRVDWLIGPGLQITLPVFDQNQAQIAKARLLLWQEEKQLAEIFEQIAEDVRTSTAILRTADELAQLLGVEGLPLAEQSMGTASRLYDAGEESILAVLGAQDTLTSQRAANIDAQLSYALALTDLERTLGGRLPSDGSVEQVLVNGNVH